MSRVERFEIAQTHHRLWRGLLFGLLLSIIVAGGVVMLVVAMGMSPAVLP